MTNKQIQHIARLSKRICNVNGLGNHLVIWSDGSYSEATGPCDCVARFRAGGQEAPLARFTYPVTATEVRSRIEEAEAHMCYQQEWQEIQNEQLN